MKKIIIPLVLLTIFSCNIPKKEVIDSYENGMIEAIGYYIVDHGEKIYVKKVYYYSNGLRKEVQHFDKNGNKDGKWVSWFPNGSKHWLIHYKNGVKDGKYIVWYKNGNKQLEGYYANGLADGKWIIYDQDGKKLQVLYYKAGKILNNP